MTGHHCHVCGKLRSFSDPNMSFIDFLTGSKEKRTLAGSIFTVKVVFRAYVDVFIEYKTFTIRPTSLVALVFSRHFPEGNVDKSPSL